MTTIQGVCTAEMTAGGLQWHQKWKWTLKKGSIPLSEFFMFNKGYFPPWESGHLDNHYLFCPKGATKAISAHDLPLALILKSTQRKTNDRRKSCGYFKYGLMSVHWHNSATWLYAQLRKTYFVSICYFVYSITINHYIWGTGTSKWSELYFPSEGKDWKQPSVVLKY